MATHVGMVKGVIYYAAMDLNTGSWAGWISLQGSTKDTPALAVLAMALE
jgi:hypothetical protein